MEGGDICANKERQCGGMRPLWGHVDASERGAFLELYWTGCDLAIGNCQSSKSKRCAWQGGARGGWQGWEDSHVRSLLLCPIRSDRVPSFLPCGISKRGSGLVRAFAVSSSTHLPHRCFEHAAQAVSGWRR